MWASRAIGAVPADTTSYVDSTALRGTSYTYRVVPWRYDLFGGAPDTVTVQTGAGIAAPEAFKAVVAPPTSVRLSWKGTFAAGSQVVVQRENCDIYGCYGWLTIGSVDASTRRFTDSALLPGATYIYRIRAVAPNNVGIKAANPRKPFSLPQAEPNARTSVRSQPGLPSRWGEG